MKELLPILVLSGCTRLPAECKPQIEAVEEKCRLIGTHGTLEPELTEAKVCIGKKVEAVCTQNHVLEPRQVIWSYSN